MMTQTMTRGRRSRISLSLLLALGLILALATTGLAAPPAPGDIPAAENNPNELWVQPTRSLDWDLPAAPDERAGHADRPRRAHGEQPHRDVQRDRRQTSPSPRGRWSRSSNAA